MKPLYQGTSSTTLADEAAESSLEICLVSMPYAAVQRPSIALGVLKACLEQASIATQVLYPNLWFSEEIGVGGAKIIGVDFPTLLIGEWTFSGAAFPDFAPDHDAFLSRIEAIFRHHPPMQALLDGRDLKSSLRQVRRRAEGFIGRVADHVLALNPRIVGCSSMFQQHCASLALLRRIKQLAPDIITLIGGANCEGQMGLATRRFFPWIDFVVSGEAEELIVPLCRSLLDQGLEIDAAGLPYGVMGPHSIDGSEPSEAGAPAPRAVVHDVESLPVPDYGDYFEGLSRSTIAPYVKPGLLIETSRGCWWGEKSHCTFCGLNRVGLSHRSKPAHRVLDELADLSRRYGLRNFEAADNIMDMGYFETVLAELADLDAPYNLFYETKSNLKRRHVERFAAAGVTWIQPGIESLHDQALELIAKGNSALMNIQLLKWARELGIYVIWNLLSEIPGESDLWYQEMATVVPKIAHLQPPSSVAKVQFHRFSPYHMRPREFDLELTPEPWYRYVYPLDADALDELAYFFVDAGRDEQSAGERPGLAALTRAVVEWKTRYWLPSGNGTKRPELRYDDDGTRLHLIDTRPDARANRASLEGIERAVLRSCESMRDLRSLSRVLLKDEGIEAAADQVKAAVESLAARHLVLCTGGKVLSLALRCRPRREPDPEDYPGGRLINPRPLDLVGSMKV